ncbi:hypothetical protein MCAP1_000333 [Malassezia caprae]|uniref:Arrestin-like N-terminal domain-containing protein n=1 Tax=Malassezia caprae TaxID=1381934 RepID=A0AAF0E7E7_9BASI|nr:hypothetical protein MCAP1_000333 [Malassezia caprae]
MKSAQVAPCEVWVHLPSDLVWLTPPASEDVPSHDQLLDGIVEIECPTDRVLYGIDIRLLGVQTIGYPARSQDKLGADKARVLRWEEEVVLDRTLALDTSAQAGNQRLPAGTGAGERGVALTKGVHDFEFHLIVPAWVPPYERCQYGRTKYTITATVRGAGKNGRDVAVSRDLVPVQQQTPEIGPLAFELTFNDTHESLHDMTVALTGVSLTVAGVLHLSLVHPTPPPTLNVLMVRVFVEQMYELYSPHADTWELMPVEKLKVWELGVPAPRKREMNHAPYWELGVWTAEGVQRGTRLGRAARGAEGVVRPLADDVPSMPGYRIKTAVRLPDHARLRPSTMQGTRTRLRLSHAIGVEVLFSRLDLLEDRSQNEMVGLPRSQVFSMTKTVSIPTCECTHDAIHLPPYTEASPVTSAPSTPRTARAPTLPLPRSDAPLAAQPEWNKLLHSLQSLSVQRRRRRPEVPPGRDAPRPMSMDLSGSGPGTPVIPVRRPNDAILVQRSQSQPAHLPRNLPVGTPWAVTNMPPRSGESSTCNCAQPMAQLLQLDERLIEGAPTAPGAWDERGSTSAAPPPWTPSSRPTSPTHEWYTP